jgi:hypothetical protein
LRPRCLLTPAGLDIYSRSKDGLSDDFIEGLIGDIGSLGEVGLLVKDEERLTIDSCNGGMFLNFVVQCHDRDAASTVRVRGDDDDLQAPKFS